MMELNKIYCMNYIDAIEQIDEESIDLVLIDIPYNISRENNFKTMKDRKGRNGIEFGEWDKNFDISGLNNIQRVIKKGGSLVIFHSFEQFSDLQKVFNELVFKDKMVWKKTNPMPRNRDRRYISNIELISWYVKEGVWIFNRQNKNYESSVFEYPSESGGGFKRYHPTQKNLNLVKYLIKIHSRENDVVLDCFLGSGTTTLACKDLKRNFIGVDIDQKYVDIANKRLSEL